MPSIYHEGKSVSYAQFYTGPVPVLFMSRADDFWHKVAKLLPWDYYAAALTWPESEERLAENVFTFADGMKMKKLHLVGYGDGARAAIRAAIAQPDRITSLTLLAPFAGARSLNEALPWQQVQEVRTPIMLLEPDNASQNMQIADDRLVNTLVNVQPEIVKDYREPINDDMARRLASTIVLHLVRGYAGISTRGVLDIQRQPLQ